MTKKDTEKLQLLQIKISKKTMKKLKKLAINNDFNSHRKYGAIIFTKLVDNLTKKPGRLKNEEKEKISSNL
jgi:hypothetical protein